MMLGDAVLAGVDGASAGPGGWYCDVPSTPESRQAVADVAYRQGRSLHHVTVQGSRCRSMPDLLRTLGDALEFPGYYGQNLDAFNECFTDLLNLTVGGLRSAFGGPGRPVTELLISVEDGRDLLCQQDSELAGTLMALLDDAAESAGEEPGKMASFCFVFLGLPEVLRHRTP